MTRRWLTQHLARAHSWLATAAVAAAVAGCGVALPTNPDKAIGDAAKLAAEVAQATQRALSGWCPQAFHDNARHLTHNEAVACVKRARSEYLGLLRKSGFDATKVASGQP